MRHNKKNNHVSGLFFVFTGLFFTIISTSHAQGAARAEFSKAEYACVSPSMFYKISQAGKAGNKQAIGMYLKKGCLILNRGTEVQALGGRKGYMKIKVAVKDVGAGANLAVPKGLTHITLWTALKAIR